MYVIIPSFSRGHVMSRRPEVVKTSQQAEEERKGKLLSCLRPLKSCFNSFSLRYLW